MKVLRHTQQETEVRELHVWRLNATKYLHGIARLMQWPGNGLIGGCSISGRKNGGVSFFHHRVQTDSGSHPA